MSKSFLELSIPQFLDCITWASETYSIDIYNSIHNRKETITGSFHYLESIISGLDQQKNIEAISKLRECKSRIYDYDLCELDVLNYLEHITSNFKPDKTAMAIQEFGAYYFLVFRLRMNDESIAIYRFFNRTIPMIERFSLDGKIRHEEPDYDIMTSETHSMYLEELIVFARKTLSDKADSILKSNTKADHIFRNNGYDLFNFLINRFITGTGGRQRDVLFLYHKLSNCKPQYIHAKQKKFIDWFNEDYEIDLEINQNLSPHQVSTVKRENLFTTSIELYKRP